MRGRMGKGCLTSTGGLSASAAWVSSVVAGDEATSITGVLACRLEHDHVRDRADEGKIPRVGRGQGERSLRRWGCASRSTQLTAASTYGPLETRFEASTETQAKWTTPSRPGAWNNGNT
jgi:hypothetical protein